MKTFACNFGKGISCKVVTTDSAPPAGTKHIRTVEWSGKPHPGHLRPYIAWMNSVNALLATEWQVKLMHVYQIKPALAEIWTYEPNQPPKRVEIISLK